MEPGLFSWCGVDGHPLTETAGVPDGLGLTLFLIALSLAMAPYWPGADFGVFRIPEFSPAWRRRLRVVGPMVLLVVVVAHVPVPAAAPDPWWDCGSWRVDANDERFGWQQTLNPKSDHRPVSTDRVGVLMLHPINEQRPAVLRYAGSLPEDATTLVVVVGGSVYGDCELQVYANGDLLPPSPLRVDGSRWNELEFDIRHVPRENPRLELRVAAGGDRSWWYEGAFIDSVSFR
jgi:hypothetical protein